MRYACPKCGETFAVRPPSGTCPICDAAVLPEPQIHEAEPHGENEGFPSPKRRLQGERPTFRECEPEVAMQPRSPANDPESKPGPGGGRGRFLGARDVVDMWGNTRMVVLTAISASLYAAILIPFKVLPIIPGVTEFRPANAVPVVCSFLFGPAGAWGAAIGNVIGDFFGGIGPGDLFGFVGNFLYGLIPYKVWEALTDRDPLPETPAMWLAFIGTILLASAVCALVIGWGINLLGFVPFSVLANIIVMNDFLVAVVLSPFLLAVIYPRVKRGQLLYRDVMHRPTRPRWSRRLGLGLVICATVTGMLLGNLLSSGRIAVPFLPHAAASTTHAADVGLGLLPAILLLAIGVALL